MTELYPAGSTFPVQPWLIEDIQRQLGDQKESVRESGRYKQYLVQRFGVWRVFPVKVGRWGRQPYWTDLSGDPLDVVLAPIVLISRGGRWALYGYVQLLDPSSGMPISELRFYDRLSVGTDDENLTWDQTRQLAFLGDPRIGGLIAPVHADAAKQVARASRREGPRVRSVADFEQQGAKLITRPYRDFADRSDGPWLIDHPDKPRRYWNGWKASPWYRRG